MTQRPLLTCQLTSHNTPRWQIPAVSGRYPQHARDRIRNITDRSRLRVPVEIIVRDINTFLLGWAGFFRYGNSARTFDMIQAYTLGRLALFMAKRHKRSRGWGWSLVAHSSPDHLGLINLEGTIVAPRPNRPWRGTEHRR